MPRDEENYVALFIDWDNLAISTAVDFAGAVPDVRAIVRAAQRSGTVLLARAYAEWNVSSDRLSVYRAGVEPVYAPTFRFEPEPGSQVPRGKSLADPCLVTDCIDTMHLMPNVNVFCLVSGDKDLIPIVRLAQLRGKRVVVIGPDFVAAILREMADEYIPYRGLVEISETQTPAEVSLQGQRGQRRVSGPQGRIASVAAAAVARTPSAPLRSAPTAPAPTPITRPTPLETNGNGNAAAAEVPAASIIAEPVVEAVTTEEALDSGPLFETIGSIVREREQTGKPRLRATNLKDQLLARITGFDERKYGFSRFKDLLTAAEKAGVIVVSRTGPVQWVASASPPATTPAPAPAPIAVPAGPALETAVEPTEASSVSVVEAPTPSLEEGDQDPDLEVVRFILDLRDRSRWLTYTYLLTNLLNHLGKGGSDASADAAARTTLNRLVQSGVLIVDREPREIEVNGTRHRVRLCHIVDEHPLIVSLRGQASSVTTEPEAEEPVSISTVAVEETTPVEPAEYATTSESVPAVEAIEAPAEAAAAVAVEPVEETREPVAEAVTEAPAEVVVTAAAEEPTAVEAAPVEVAPEPAAVEIVETEPVSALTESVEVPSAPVTDSGSNVEVLTSEEPEPARDEVSAEATAEAAVSPIVLSLADSYQLLRQVVREATGPNRPSTGPAAVKNRLVRRLGAFDEHVFGFSKFKDYLLAAERAGAVKVELVGTTARVSLPSE